MPRCSTGLKVLQVTGWITGHGDLQGPPQRRLVILGREGWGLIPYGFDVGVLHACGLVAVPISAARGRVGFADVLDNDAGRPASSSPSASSCGSPPEGRHRDRADGGPDALNASRVSRRREGKRRPAGKTSPSSGGRRSGLRTGTEGTDVSGQEDGRVLEPDLLRRPRLAPPSATRRSLPALLPVPHRQTTRPGPGAPVTEVRGHGPSRTPSPQARDLGRRPPLQCPPCRRDRRPPPGRQALTLLTAAVEAGDAARHDLAFLTDRCLVANGRPQVYGSQYEQTTGGLRCPIEDPGGVDERRRCMGLSPLAQYAAFLETTWAEA
ncbi:DUF6624 domain-containing protein [Streptomyces sp. NPDC088707]|uniref:DUF6624 domain-containing protein n=1 Tax=Streptomyces sp. NPDC088707 TaxID=3365871 RepID=UPI0037F5B7BC